MPGCPVASARLSAAHEDRSRVDPQSKREPHSATPASTTSPHPPASHALASATKSDELATRDCLSLLGDAAHDGCSRPLTTALLTQPHG
eukprot:7333074-Prymnesium_polylepis.1